MKVTISFFEMLGLFSRERERERGRGQVRSLTSSSIYIVFSCEANFGGSSEPRTYRRDMRVGYVRIKPMPICLQSKKEETPVFYFRCFVPLERFLSRD